MLGGFLGLVGLGGLGGFVGLGGLAGLGGLGGLVGLGGGLVGLRELVHKRPRDNFEYGDIPLHTDKDHINCIKIY